MSRDKPQVQTLRKHPEPYQHDLNPDAMAGQNIGLGETQPSKEAPTAIARSSPTCPASGSRRGRARAT